MCMRCAPAPGQPVPPGVCEEKQALGVCLHVPDSAGAAPAIRDSALLTILPVVAAEPRTNRPHGSPLSFWDDDVPFARD